MQKLPTGQSALVVQLPPPPRWATTTVHSSPLAQPAHDATQLPSLQVVKAGQSRFDWHAFPHAALLLPGSVTHPCPSPQAPHVGGPPVSVLPELPPQSGPKQLVEPPPQSESEHPVALSPPQLGPKHSVEPPPQSEPEQPPVEPPPQSEPAQPPVEPPPQSEPEQPLVLALASHP